MPASAVQSSRAEANLLTTPELEPLLMHRHAGARAACSSRGVRRGRVGARRGWCSSCPHGSRSPTVLRRSSTLLLWMRGPRAGQRQAAMQLCETANWGKNLAEGRLEEAARESLMPRRKSSARIGSVLAVAEWELDVQRASGAVALCRSTSVGCRLVRRRQHPLSSFNRCHGG